MIVQKSDILLLCHRRLFAEDIPRLFVGSVDNCEDGLILISGYSWGREKVTGLLIRKDDIRTKVVSLISGTTLVYQLPRDTDMTKLTIETGEHQQLILHDGKNLSMDITDRH